MSTTTAVQLEAYGNGTTYEPNTASTLRPTRAGLAENASTSHPESDDPALEASRIADSTVPDGGYGWVVIGACAVVACFDGYRWSHRVENATNVRDTQT
ncbi:hypothetical protein FOMG_17819 [Fusarium oxysporum f. sp. melonis 26406]|uniref:Uncharacterized protein n=1 Tax=Fusarium oxysporum f. sp. melonis 26406 TaxID=1089452 RepID=W9ZBA9_FUSOX|nr:hypothetical protein FOMG_17819 [Fusarium oxysporum f. sp. melonis 26406]